MAFQNLTMIVSKEEFNYFTKLTREIVSKLCFRQLAVAANVLSIDEFGDNSFCVRRTRQLRRLAEALPSTNFAYSQLFSNLENRQLEPFDVNLKNIIRHCRLMLPANNHRMHFAGNVDVAPNDAYVGGVGVDQSGLQQVRVVLNRLDIRQNIDDDDNDEISNRLEGQEPLCSGVVRRRPRINPHRPLIDDDDDD